MHDKVKEALRKNPKCRQALDILCKMSFGTPGTFIRPIYESVAKKELNVSLDDVREYISELENLNLIESSDNKIILKKKAFNYSRS